MGRQLRVPLVVFACAAASAAGCGGTTAVRRPITSPAVAHAEPAPLPPPPPPTVQPDDPILKLITLSQAHFDQGESELRLGHLERARREFDLAMDELLQSPSGARSNARLREHFDRMVDRISAYELRALAEGDGFAERPTVPASLDELLAISTFDMPLPAAGLRETVETDLKSTAHDVPIPLNPQVLAYVDLFQGRLRDWFQMALQRGVPHVPMIQAELKAHGLPLDLAYIPIVESAFRADALSRAKAKGFWQLMRGTAVEQGLKYDWYIDERSSPEKSTVAAVKYLKRLNTMFAGDWHLTLASYNGGPGTVQRAVRRKGTADFWPLAGKGRYLPQETREYVPMVLAAIVIARNPSQYGFTVGPADPQAVETVTVPGPVDLRRVAEWAGISVDDVQRLNPELRRWTTPVRSESFTLRLPVGTAALVEQRLAESPPEALATLQWHTVRRGETLQTIANKLKVRRTHLMEANYLGAKDRIQPGQKLVVPREPTTLLAARTDRSEPVVAQSRPIAPAPTAAPMPAPVPAGQSARVTYHVRRGDSLSSIARVFRTSVSALRSWNRLTSDRLKPGDRLTVYTTRTPASLPRP